MCVVNDDSEVSTVWHASKRPGAPTHFDRRPPPPDAAHAHVDGAPDGRHGSGHL